MTRVSRAVVTGGAGFIGSHIVDELVRRGIETAVVDDFSSGSMDNLQKASRSGLVKVLAGDVRQAWSLLRDYGNVDVVFHEAAIASVPKSVAHPLRVHDVNVNATLELLNYCVRMGVRRFVFASSAAVYGVIKNPPASETDLCRPTSPYGASKLAIENYLSAFQSSYGLETVALRYFNVYGPRQRMNDDYSGVITIFAKRLLSGSSPTIYGDGLQTRDFVNVDDIVQANVRAMESRHAGGEVFNVASGSSVSVLRLLETMVGATGAEAPRVLHMPPRAGDVRSGSGSISKIRRVMGYEPKVRLRDGLASLVRDLKQRTSIAVPDAQRTR